MTIPGITVTFETVAAEGAVAAGAVAVGALTGGAVGTAAAGCPPDGAVAADCVLCLGCAEDCPDPLNAPRGIRNPASTVGSMLKLYDVG